MRPPEMRVKSSVIMMDTTTDQAMDPTSYLSKKDAASMKAIAARASIICDGRGGPYLNRNIRPSASTMVVRARSDEATKAFRK